MMPVSRRLEPAETGRAKSVKTKTGMGSGTLMIVVASAFAVFSTTLSLVPESPSLSDNPPLVQLRGSAP